MEDISIEINKIMKLPFYHYHLKLQGLLFIIGVALASASDQSQNASYDRTVMRPRDPFGFVGSEVALCCTFPQASSDVLATDVIFTCPDNSVSPSRNYHGVDEKEVCTNVSVTSVKQEGFCVCKIPDQELNASQFLQVDVPVEAITSLACIYNFRDIHCTWSLPDFKHPNYVSASISWTPAITCSGNENNAPCGSISSCRISFINIFCDYNISVKVTYKSANCNRLESTSVSAPKTFLLDTIAKLPPLSVQVLGVNQTCVTLAWYRANEVDGVQNIQFNYSSEWEPQRIHTHNQQHCATFILSPTTQ